MVEEHPQDSDPALPPELERLIFEIAFTRAEGSHAHRKNIQLVSRRIYEWTRPILYRVLCEKSKVYIDAPDFPFSTAKLEDVGVYVQHLMIRSVDQDKTIRLLTSCPNIEDLAIWSGGAPMMPLLQRLPLRRLSARLSSLGREDYRGPAFSNLTHLDVISLEGVRWKDWEVLTLLPKLSHLSINLWIEIETLKNLLAQCLELRLFAVLIVDPSKKRDGGHLVDDYIGVDDTRLILVDDYDGELIERDWLEGAYGRYDIWDFGGLISEARDRCFLNDNSQRWLSRNFQWDLELNEAGRKWYDSISFPTIEENTGDLDSGSLVDSEAGSEELQRQAVQSLRVSSPSSM